MTAYLEHMALRVNNLDWHIQFFEEVFGMTIRMEMGEAPNRKVWLHTGIQMNEDTNFSGAEGRADHLGIMCDNVDEVLAKAYDRGVKELPQGHNWIELPSGLCIEVIPGKKEVIETVVAQEPWID